MRGRNAGAAAEQLCMHAKGAPSCVLFALAFGGLRCIFELRGRSFPRFFVASPGDRLNVNTRLIWLVDGLHLR